MRKNGHEQQPESGAEDVLKHHCKLEAAREDVTNIQRAIENQLMLIEDAKSTIPQVTDRQAERHALLAEIALGNANKEMLDHLDVVIAKDKQSVAEAETLVSSGITEAQSTVLGLEHKLMAALGVLAGLEAETGKVAKNYFMREAEIAAAQYVACALELKGLYIRLLGLAQAIKRHAGKDITGIGVSDIRIPKFNLPQFAEVECFPRNEPGALFYGYYLAYGAPQVQESANKDEAKFKTLLMGRRD